MTRKLIGKKRGRPKVYKPKCNRKYFRITDEQQNMLDYICDRYHISQAEAMRKGIELLYKEALYSDI